MSNKKSITDMRTWYRNKKTREVSLKIKDLINRDDIVSLNYDYIDNYLENFKQGIKTRDTLFKEIEVVDFSKIFKNLDNMYEWEFRYKQISQDEFILKFIETYTDYIKNNWRNDCFNIIFHSSGYDSRILGGILNEIYHQQGQEWFGRNYLFICLSPEGRYFKEILEYYNDDWKNKYYIFDRNYESNINIKDAWEKLNGICSYPANCLHNAIKQIKEIYHITTEVEIWTAGFFNEIFDRGLFRRYNSNPIGDWIEKYYLSYYSQFCSAFDCNRIHFPLLNQDTLRLITESDINLNKELRLDVLRAIDFNLYKLNRMKKEDVDKIRVLNDNFWINLYNNYIKTDFYQQVIKGSNYENIEISDMLIKSKFWILWSVASWVNYLKKDRRKIDYER